MTEQQIEHPGLTEIPPVGAFAGSNPKGVELLEHLPDMGLYLPDILRDSSTLNNQNTEAAFDSYRQERINIRPDAKKGDEISVYEEAMSKFIGITGPLKNVKEVDEVRYVIQQLVEKTGGELEIGEVNIDESPADTNAWLRFSQEYWPDENAIDIPPPEKNRATHQRQIEVESAPSTLEDVPVDTSELRERLTGPNGRLAVKNAQRRTLH